MAFAVRLISLEVKLEDCPPLIEEERYRGSYEKLRGLLSPPIKEVVLRSPKRIVKIGGKYVLFRHELKYHNPTAIAVDVDDSMETEVIIKRVKMIEGFEYEYVGQKLKLDAIAVRSVTNDPKKFAKTVYTVAENSTLPLILCSTNPTVVEAALDVLNPPHHRPLIYAATKDNWREMAEIAKRFDVPLTITVPGDLDMLVSLAKTLSEGMELKELALDPGCFVGVGGLSYTIKAYSWLRYKAAYDLWRYAGYPLVGTPISVWAQMGGDLKDVMWWEAILAVMLMTRYTDLIIVHSLDGWVLLPQVMWRFQLYTDPRKPVSVPPGLREIGKPDEMSPVLVTTNYALTYSLVLSDAEKAKVNAWLLVIDTEGLAIDVSVAGRKFTGDKVAETIKSTGLEKRVSHRVLIIPGKAARVSGEVEDMTKWRVLVGPTDSSEIGKWLEKNWTPEKIKELTGL
jgi:acetyl-CoA decarbonylase/synthase complex subunit gamma